MLKINVSESFKRSSIRLLSSVMNVSGSSCSFTALQLKVINCFSLLCSDLIFFRKISKDASTLSWMPSGFWASRIRRYEFLRKYAELIHRGFLLILLRRLISDLRVQLACFRSRIQCFNLSTMNS